MGGLSLWAGLGLALVSAAGLNAGFFLQHRAAGRLPALSLRRPLRSLAVLFRSPVWLLGYGAGIAGWALYIVALRLAPLSIVQAASAGGVGLLALLARRAGARLSRREWAGTAAAVAGLAGLALSLAGRAAVSAPAPPSAVVLWVGASAAAAAAAAGAPRRLLAPGAGLGAAAGLLYAAGDVATKAAVGAGGRIWFVPVLLACHGAAFVALQLAFQRGGALATAGVSSLLTNALPIAAGVALYGEAVPAGPAGAARVAGFAAVVLGAALLARAAPHGSAAQALAEPGELLGEVGPPQAPVVPARVDVEHVGDAEL